MPARTVLLVEDDQNLRETLRYRFSREGYNVIEAVDGETALDLARSESPDLVLLDIMLPKLDGLEVCRILRKDSMVPVLMLTAKDEEVDKVVGLEIGADDYVTKPFSMRELLARIKALLRRAEQQLEADKEGAERPLSSGDLRLSNVERRAWLGDRLLELKPKEFDLLAFLMKNKGRCASREMVLDRVWGYDAEVESRTVDVHIRWLREKIERDPGHPRRIATVRGLGYRFEG